MSNVFKHIDANGERFIAGWEGCILYPYNDPLNATIGIGHLIHYGRVTQDDIRKYAGFTYADALKLLSQDVGSAEWAIRQQIKIELNQNEYNAIISAVFNCGPGVIEGSVGALINARQFDNAMQALQAWDHVNGEVIPGLHNRREAEAQLFKSSPPPPPEYWGPHELNWMHEYDKLLRQNRARNRRLWLRKQMAKRAREIVLAAEHHGGWGILNRRHRYHSMHARSM